MYKIVQSISNTKYNLKSVLNTVGVQKIKYLLTVLEINKTITKKFSSTKKTKQVLNYTLLWKTTAKCLKNIEY